VCVCVCVSLSFWSGTVGPHLFYIDIVVVDLLEGHSDVFCRGIARQMPDNGVNRFPPFA
jgi:hypothetical protein